jgi:hypothetical protein
VASLLREKKLSLYLEEATKLQWQWGLHDCALWMADYVARVRGGDPGAEFRGKYASEFRCGLFLARRGGLLKVVGDVAASIGLSETDDPKRGDIGVIWAPALNMGRVKMEPTSAIYLGGNWARFSHLGLIVGDAKFISAWSV